MLPVNGFQFAKAAGADEAADKLMKGAVTGARYLIEGSQLSKWTPLAKAAVTTASNIVGYDLQAPARLLLPVITPIRNSLPRRSRAANPGTQSNWKMINAIGGFADAGYNQMGWVNEGARAGQFTFSAVSASAAYQTIGTEDAITFEEDSASAGYEDAQSLATFLLLQQMMIKEEMALLAGNNGLVLGTPTTPTLAAGGSGATLPTLTYSVIVVGLTIEGYTNSTLVAPLAVATSKAITGPDGKVATVNGGSSNKSAAATQAITLGQVLSVSTPVINGAVAYAWYVGAAGSEKLEKVTSINSATFSAPLAGTGQAATAITGDKSANNGALGGGTNQVTAFDGLITTTFRQGALGNSLVQALATGVAGTGTVLTATNKGTVKEIDALLQYLWNTWRISPNAMWVHSQQLNDLTSLCLNSSSAPLLRVNTTPEGSAMINAATVLEFYTNFYSMSPGGVKMPVMLHPLMPAGTIFFQCTMLPPHFVSNETPQVAEVLTRRDYYRIDWPLVTRERQYGVYAEEVLAVYAPQGFALLTNIAPLP